jgi:hypothetical protein
VLEGVLVSWFSVNWSFGRDELVRVLPRKFCAQSAGFWV